jgi:hypothetical protein
MPKTSTWSGHSPKRSHEPLHVLDLLFYALVSRKLSYPSAPGGDRFWAEVIIISNYSFTY